MDPKNSVLPNEFSKWIPKITTHGSIANGPSNTSSNFNYCSTLFFKYSIDVITPHFSLFDNELHFVDRLISADVRNNSAWNQRFFVLNHTGLNPEIVQRELNYVMNRIRLVKNNESTWNFLRGILQYDDGKLCQFHDVSSEVSY